jgi:predicted alpha/beta-fold hydrolase
MGAWISNFYRGLSDENLKRAEDTIIQQMGAIDPEGYQILNIDINQELKDLMEQANVFLYANIKHIF